MLKQIILIEGEKEFEIIKSKKNLSEFLIIGFDYIAINLLEKNQIKHNRCDEYFNEDDKIMLDNFSIELSKSWYKVDRISKYLEYNELNLGYVLELEMLPYLFQTLKRIVGIRNIIAREKPNRIIAYSLSNYLDKEFLKKEHIIFNENSYNSLYDLHYNNIEISFKIGPIRLKKIISRQNFHNFKNIIEYLVYNLFQIKTNLSNYKNSKSILISDFNTLMYEDLFSEFKKSQKNLLVLNQRRPAIWNLETLKIIKRSKVSVILLKDFENDDVKADIKIKQKIFQECLIKFFSNQQILNEKFSINKVTFWNIIQEEFTKICSERGDEFIRRFILLNKIFQHFEIHCILDWARTGMEEKILAHIANYNKVPTFCLQHGVMSLNRTSEKYLSFHPILPSKNTTMCVWGKEMEKFILQHSKSKQNVRIIGSPRHDKFFSCREKIKNDGYVLIASNILTHYNYHGNETRAYEMFIDCLVKILIMIKNTTKLIPVVKLHPAEFFDITTIIKKINPEIQIYKYEDAFSLIIRCDSVISLNYSTILLDALILNKPSMVVLPERQGFENEDMIINGACISVSNIDELEKSLGVFLHDEKLRNTLIYKGNEFVNSYMSNHGKASEKLVNLLNNDNY